MNKAVDNIVSQIVERFNPEKVILFGSQAKGTATDQSDIDICVVVETDNKRRLLAEMYYEIDSEIPFDLLLYTPHEWEECLKDKSSFAYKINTEGAVLYGRQQTV
ncbi:MAG TPA: nucleotidyltransferase domain-containing protein [Clostridiales bacterium]|nr:nucleotidyltransferase domain-containing protein [Clostridiales bacterium]